MEKSPLFIFILVCPFQHVGFVLLTQMNIKVHNEAILGKPQPKPLLTVSKGRKRDSDVMLGLLYE